MISIERQIGNVKEIKIPKYYGPRNGIQKETIFRYVCLKCNYREDFDTAQQYIKCNCEVVS